MAKKGITATFCKSKARTSHFYRRKTLQRRRVTRNAQLRKIKLVKAVTTTCFPPYNGTFEQRQNQYSLPPPRPSYDPTKISPLLTLFQTKDFDLDSLNTILPEHWALKSNSSMCQTQYITKGIPSTTPQYKYVEKKFLYSNPRGEVRAIDVIQNPYTYTRYQIKKAELQKLSSNKLEEHHLFHGTNLDKIDSILTQNLDWRLHGARVGSKFGQGVSFSPLSSYAIHYTDKRNTYNVMILARVLTSTISFGTRKTKIPPLGADTTVSDSGKVIVKYNDDEFYPEYLIYFKYIEMVPQRTFERLGSKSEVEERERDQYSRHEVLPEGEYLSCKTASATVLKELANCWSVNSPALKRSTEKSIKKEQTESSSHNQDELPPKIQVLRNKLNSDETVCDITGKILSPDVDYPYQQPESVQCTPTQSNPNINLGEKSPADDVNVFQVPFHRDASNNFSLQQYPMGSGVHTESGFPPQNVTTPNFGNNTFNYPSTIVSQNVPTVENFSPGFPFSQSYENSTWNSCGPTMPQIWTEVPSVNPYPSSTVQSGSNYETTTGNSYFEVPMQNETSPHFPSNNFTNAPSSYDPSIYQRVTPWDAINKPTTSTVSPAAQYSDLHLTNRDQASDTSTSYQLLREWSQRQGRDVDYRITPHQMSDHGLNRGQHDRQHPTIRDRLGPSVDRNSFRDRTSSIERGPRARRGRRSFDDRGSLSDRGGHGSTARRGRRSFDGRGSLSDRGGHGSTARRGRRSFDGRSSPSDRGSTARRGRRLSGDRSSSSDRGRHGPTGARARRGRRSCDDRSWHVRTSSGDGGRRVSTYSDDGDNRRYY